MAWNACCCYLAPDGEWADERRYGPFEMRIWVLGGGQKISGKRLVTVAAVSSGGASQMAWLKISTSMWPV
jgi:hypothetical protein